MMEEIKGNYTQANADNIDKAIEGLDQFTKNWCMNCKETEEKNDLVFRCSKCEFRAVDQCLVKKIRT